MLDPEAVLSDAELAIIFRDEELKEIYDVSAAVRGACVQPMKIDVKQEWRLFRHRILPRPPRWRWMMRVAAIFLGVLFVSAIVKIAIDRVLSDEIPVVADSKVSTTKRTNENQAKPEQNPGVETTDYPAHHASTPKKSAKHTALAKKVEIDEEDFDLDEYLRLQQARIDNDMALIRAELYIAELQAIEGSELTVDGEGDIEQNEISYVIMQ